ncbi:MAG: hypothetical protein PHT31_01180 [Candidatus Omnitrophica bacterium]|nr:hypothetical protein [Candidatus Omnitrophota bacterium]MDD5652759.1 hypothetical protein [Candidatus Omnitrophota bacterium]
MGHSFVFAAQQSTINSSSAQNTKAKKGLPELGPLAGFQKMARDYRQQGVVLQDAGNLEDAKAFYQRAVIADPLYAVPYNDLGIIAEAEGDLPSAEEYYLRCIGADPGFLSAYSNLALLYETQRNLKKAQFFWEKRAELGLPDEPWTLKAQQRVEDIKVATGQKQGELAALGEKEVADLAEGIAAQKKLIREDDKAAARIYFERAKKHYDTGDTLQAYREALDAMQLDSDNLRIVEFVDKLQNRLLVR